MAASIYVYYRVDAARAAMLQGVLRAIQARLGERWGVGTGLLRRVDDPLTWMETYSDVEDRAGLLAELEAALDAAGFDDCLAAGASRHSECFEPCA